MAIEIELAEKLISRIESSKIKIDGVHFYYHDNEPINKIYNLESSYMGTLDIAFCEFKLEIEKKILKLKDNRLIKRLLQKSKSLKKEKEKILNNLEDNFDEDYKINFKNNYESGITALKTLIGIELLYLGNIIKVLEDHLLPDSLKRTEKATFNGEKRSLIVLFMLLCDAKIITFKRRADLTKFLEYYFLCPDPEKKDEYKNADGITAEISELIVKIETINLPKGIQQNKGYDIPYWKLKWKEIDTKMNQYFDSKTRYKLPSQNDFWFPTKSD